MPVVNREGKVQTNGRNGAHETASPPISPRRAFGRLLPSAPIALPPPMDEISAIYDLKRVMDLEQTMYGLVGTLAREQDEITFARMTAAEAFDAHWQTHRDQVNAQQDVSVAERKAYSDAHWEWQRQRDTFLHEWNTLEHQKMLILAQHLVISLGVVEIQTDERGAKAQTFTWPFDDVRPDPDKPDTWDGLSDLVLHWLTDLTLPNGQPNPHTGISQAQTQVDSFLLGPPSKATS